MPYVRGAESRHMAGRVRALACWSRSPAALERGVAVSCAFESGIPRERYGSERHASQSSDHGSVSEENAACSPDHWLARYLNRSPASGRRPPTDLRDLWGMVATRIRAIGWRLMTTNVTHARPYPCPISRGSGRQQGDASCFPRQSCSDGAAPRRWRPPILPEVRAGRPGWTPSVDGGLDPSRKRGSVCLLRRLAAGCGRR